MQYDNIIYCGSLYAGGILGFNFIKKNFDKIKDKKIITVAVGATIKKDEAVEEIKNKNFTPEMKDKVKLFLLRGGLNYKKMHIFDRFLMFMLINSIKRQKKDQTDIEAKAMVATYGKNVDFTDEKSIKPIIDCINNKDN